MRNRLSKLTNTVKNDREGTQRKGQALCKFP